MIKYISKAKNFGFFSKIRHKNGARKTAMSRGHLQTEQDEEEEEGHLGDPVETAHERGGELHVAELVK